MRRNGFNYHVNDNKMWIYNGKVYIIIFWTNGKILKIYSHCNEMSTTLIYCYVFHKIFNAAATVAKYNAIK